MKTLFLVVLFSFGSSACTDQNIPRTTSDSSIAIATLQSPAGPGSTAPHLQMSSDGTLVLSWLKFGTGASELQYAIYDGAWSPATTVASGNDWFVNDVLMVWTEAGEPSQLATVRISNLSL